MAGLGSLGQRLTRRGGELTQRGTWLEGGYLTLARGRSRPPDPPLVALNEIHPAIGIASGWRSWTELRFPTADLGRWTRAQTHLRAQLDR